MGDALDAVNALLAENRHEIDRLRNSEIPHHAGMAMASRILAADIPTALVAEIERDMNSGGLDQVAR